MSRAELLALFSRWFNREVGITLPQRPSPEAVAAARGRRLAIEAEKERLGIKRGGAPRRRRLLDEAREEGS